MKKRKSVIAVLICICILAVFLFPHPLFSTHSATDIYRIEYVANSYDARDNIDMTEQTDKEKIIDILNACKRSSIPRSIRAQTMLEGDIEISLMLDNQKAVHIYLSPNDKNSNYIYESGNFVNLGFPIRNSNKVYQEIAAMLPSN